MPPIRKSTMLIVLCALGLLAALTASACGGDEAAGGGQSAEQVLKQTFSGDKQVDSGVMNMQMSAELEGKGASAKQIEEPVKIKVSGPFESRGEDALPEMDLKLSASAGGQTVSAGVVSTGDEGFIDYQGTYYRVPDETFTEFKKDFERRQRKQGDEDDEPTLTALGVSPQKWLRDPQIEGEEEIGGAETIHLSADVNLPRLVEDVDGLLGQADDLGLTAEQRSQLPKSLDRKTRKQLEDSVKDASVDVWTGKDDKVLRKLEVNLEFDSPDGLTGEAADIAGGKLRLLIELADMNEKQDVKAPKNAKDFEDLQSQLGLLGASALGGSGSGSGSGGDTSGNKSLDTGQEQVEKLRELSGGGADSVDTERARKYLECAQDAKTVAKLEQCGDLLK